MASYYYFKYKLVKTNRKKDRMSKIVEFQGVVKTYGKG